MNLINYILNFKNNIFTNKKFALVVSLVTISLLFSYNFFLKKLYSSKIEIKVESLSEISFSPNYRLRGSFISYSEINSKATIFFEDKFVDPKDAHKKDKIFFNLINNIKKKINITYKRNFDKIFSDDIWYTIEIKEKNLDKLDINREKLFTEIKTYNMAIEKQFLDHLDKSVIPYIDYMLEKNQSEWQCSSSVDFPMEVKPRFHYAIRELMQEGYENAILNQRCAVSPSSQEAEDEIDSDSDPNSPFYGLTSSEKDKLMEAIHKDDQPRSVIKGRTLRSRKDIKNDRRG